MIEFLLRELELENDRGAVETSFIFFIACFYNIKVVEIGYAANSAQIIPNPGRVITVFLILCK